jgi:hypothetical protein
VEAAAPAGAPSGTLDRVEHPRPVSPIAAPTDLSAAWRREVGEFRAREQRRRHPLGIHVGDPGRWRGSTELPWPEPRWHDAGVRVDVVTALLARIDPTVVAASGWLTRPGVPELHDADLDWYAAAVRGFGAHDVTLTGFRAVTRTGWIDVVTGERRVWKRLRLGPSARGARRTRPRPVEGGAAGPGTRVD